jgi:hypothetical protein
LSRDEFGVLIEASADDVEKFEIGTKRIGTTRLTRIARALRVDISTLFGPGDAIDGPAEAVRSSIARVWYTPSRTVH